MSRGNPLSLTRYKNLNIDVLVNQLQEQSTKFETQRLIQTRKNRRNHQSCSEILESYPQKDLPLFNNKILKQSSRLLEEKIKPLPYKFIPKHKNDNFILPDRAFAKGKAAKRFFIKMKDSSICSFKDNQDKETQQHLHKSEKQKTIVSRQLEQFQRIVDMNDGRIKARHNSWVLHNSKHFRQTSNTTALFSEFEPVLETRQAQITQLRKMSMTKTFTRQNKWKYSTRNYNRLLSATNQSGFFSSTQMKPYKTAK